MHASSPYLVPFDGTFRVADAPTTTPGEPEGKKALAKQLRKEVKQIAELQRRLYAEDRRALLLVFQAMDAAGKDGTIRAVMSGVNPAGCQVHSFKQPSSLELDHDFLWRTSKALPERGRIGVFNRSHYEETLVVRVHPEYLKYQRLPSIPEDLGSLWSERYASIRQHEAHLARNGTVILKFWLNVSQDEQRRRLLARIQDPAKNWKFSSKDVEERKLWPAYMQAYEDTLNATSRDGAPWYAIPADHKPTMRLIVAAIVRRTLEAMDPQYPKLSAKEMAHLDEMEQRLLG